MRKPIYFLLTLLISFTFSCSSNDDSTDLNETGQNLIGQWHFSDPEIHGYEANNSFTFTSNGEVTYSYWVGGQENEYDSETGSFTIEGDILTMIYPEDVVLTFVQRVVFIDDNTVQFVQVEGSNEEPYDGEYYRTE